MNSLVLEIKNPGLDPATVYQALSELYGKGILLESQAQNSPFGRYAILGFVLQANYTGSSLEELRSFVQHNPHPSHPLINAGIGLLSYDAVRSFEKISNIHPVNKDIPDIQFMYFENQVIFDYVKDKIFLISSSKEDLVNCLEKLFIIMGLEEDLPAAAKEISTDINDELFCVRVNQALQHIFEGDAFQIVLSRNFKIPYQGSPFRIYRNLKKTSPAPFSFYISLEEHDLVGASPERLVSLHQGVVETVPIAGTRPILANEQELLEDPKENAEHMMLVDLGRNDLGKVCLTGTVEVVELKKIQRLSHVMHMVSVIRGQLDPQYDALDAIKAVFPAGTLSGAPKIRAMEIIERLETSRRGYYGGAIFVLSPSGDLDSCITIRAALCKEGIATVRAGAGIVYDSMPYSEARETRIKAMNVLAAVQGGKI